MTPEDVRRVAAARGLAVTIGPRAALPDPPPPPADCPEAAFQRAVIGHAVARGWEPYHTHDSRRSHAGFPDLVLCRPPRLLLVELKAARGRVRPAQRKWLALLRAVPGVEVAVWRPGEWESILEVLR